MAPLVHQPGSVVEISQADANVLHALAIAVIYLLVLAAILDAVSETEDDKAQTLSFVCLGFGGLLGTGLCLCILAGVPW